MVLAMFVVPSQESERNDIRVLPGYRMGQLHHMEGGKVTTDVYIWCSRQQVLISTGL